MKQRLSEPLSIPQDRREAALVYYSLIRAYWRLAEAARLGSVSDTDRNAMEADSMELLVEAAQVVSDLGPVPEELVESAGDTLQRIFFEAPSVRSSKWRPKSHERNATGNQSGDRK